MSRWIYKINEKLYQDYRTAWYEAECKPEPRVAKGVGHSVHPDGSYTTKHNQSQCINDKYQQLGVMRVKTIHLQ